MQEVRISTFKDFVGELQVTYKRTSLATEKIKSSQNASDYMRIHFDKCMDDREESKILHLNRNNCVVNVTHLTSGCDSGTIIPIKDIIREIVLIKTSAIILFHNHPSGNLKASEKDIETSKKLKKACNLVDVPLLDSIIITRESYLSLSDECLL